MNGDAAHSGFVRASYWCTFGTATAHLGASGVQRAGAGGLSVDGQGITVIDGDAFRGGQRLSVAENQVYRASDLDAVAKGDIFSDSIPRLGVVGSHCCDVLIDS